MLAATHIHKMAKCSSGVITVLVMRQTLIISFLLYGTLQCRAVLPSPSVAFKSRCRLPINTHNSYMHHNIGSVNTHSVYCRTIT